MMNLMEFVQTSNAFAAIAMILVGSAWLKQSLRCRSCACD